MTKEMEEQMMQLIELWISSNFKDKDIDLGELPIIEPTI